jgi:hypothetical protein
MPHRYSKFLLVLTILSAHELMAQLPHTRKMDLSESAKTLVEKEIGKWDYFKNAVPASDSTGRQVGWEYADIITGDFNDDGQADYALLARGVDSASQDQGYLVVLFRTDSSYSVEIVDNVRYTSDWVLFLDPKGSELYDFGTETELRLPVDGIFLYFYEKAGRTFYYRDGQFHEIYSSD